MNGHSKMSDRHILLDYIEIEAARLLLLMLPNIHIEPNGKGGLRLEIDEVSSELLDGLAMIGAHGEDDEDDGTAESNLLGLPQKLLNELFTPPPLQGYPVPPWTRPISEASESSAGVNETMAASCLLRSPECNMPAE